MVLSSLFFLDLKGKILISRDYRGEISPKYAEEFIDLLSEREIEMERSENCDGQAGSVTNIQPPIFHKDGISYCYIKHNNLYRK
jgi:AP-1 complex subunit mu